MALRYGGYPRISEDPEDLRLGTSRQRTDIGNRVELLGGDRESIVWFDENDTSAYKKKRVRRTDPLGNDYFAWRVIRPKWHAALAALRAGEIDVLVCYDLDRLARDLRDLEDGIEVVVYYGKRIEGVVPGQINLMTDDGQAMARVMVAMAAKSSADTGRRVKRAHLDSATKGTPVGGFRPFGWKADRRTLEPREHKAVLGLVDGLLAGKTLASVTKELVDAGFQTTAGKDWKPATVRQYLKNPRLYGVRTYGGEVFKDAEGNPVIGKWKPIIDEDTFNLLQARLVRPDGRSRIPSRDTKHYLLTGILRCGRCNSRMYGNKAQKGAGLFYYKCNGTPKDRHTVNASGVACDKYVTRLVMEKLATETLDSSAAATWPGELELAETQQQITDLMAQFTAKKLSGATVFPQVQALEEQMAEMTNDRTLWLAENVGPVVAEMTPAVFESLDRDQQRATIATLFDAVLVRPATRRGNTFDLSRLDAVPRG